jgi:hypothetical protein
VIKVPGSRVNSPVELKPVSVHVPSGRPVGAEQSTVEEDGIVDVPEYGPLASRETQVASRGTQLGVIPRNVRVPLSVSVPARRSSWAFVVSVKEPLTSVAPRVPDRDPVDWTFCQSMVAAV